MINHQRNKSSATSSVSAKCNHGVQRIVQWARTQIAHPSVTPIFCDTCCSTCAGTGADKRKSITRNGSDRRDKPYKIKTALLMLSMILLALYLVIALRTSFRMLAEQRKPTNILRHIQSSLIKRKIIRLPSALRAASTGADSSKKSAATNGNNAVVTDKDYFIVFDADLSGQGTGNIISGLLASHLLGDEFHRIVCVNPRYYSSFLSVFESVNPLVQSKCPIILEQINATVSSIAPHQVTVLNWLGAADECYLKKFISDRNKQIVHFVGNTYPRWPPVPDYYFLHYYQPKQVLIDYLPYQNQPKIVVHLREPDDVEYDPRLGLDNTSLVALGDALPKSEDTYLVTNNVEYYDRFKKCCSWSHAAWKSVKHSASIPDAKSVNDARQQVLQMWSDWYTILMADAVYHTHSDFSISAIHWMNNHNSYSLKGHNAETKKLETSEESWWHDGETIPLSQRTIEGKPGTTNELRGCGLWEPLG